MKKLYTIYKTINNVNNKEYIGFHSLTNNEKIVNEKSENGSIYSSGYLGSGKLIKSAIEKYGPENFTQELIYITEDKEEAEQLEKDLVNQEWVNSDSNYNVSIGGNVCILFGENNGFYNKKHTQETINKIQSSRNNTKLENNFSWCELYLVENPDKIFYSYEEVYKYFNINEKYYSMNLFKLDELINNNIIMFKSKFLLEKSKKRYIEKLQQIANEPEIAKQRAQQCSERFKGIPKSEKSNIKRGKSIKEWIANNPDGHIERMNKINKNPEKIAKTAEKHRGMKRSLETKINLAIANKNNKRKWKNIDNNEIKILKTSDITDFSNLEKISFKLYTNSEESVKGIYNGDKIPDGFTLYSDTEY